MLISVHLLRISYFPKASAGQDTGELVQRSDLKTVVL